jgi:hypothetical protein
MAIISAMEARQLDPSLRLSSDLELLDQMIRKAAVKGETAVRVPYDLCDFNGYSARFKAAGLEAALNGAGYHVETLSLDRQFVDVWIEVSWGHISA